MKNFILFMYGCGMRPGEIMALSWEDIDFQRKTISVSKTRLRNEDGRTKTNASTRYIDLLPIAEKALRAQYELTKAHEHIFVNSSGKPFYSHVVIGVSFQRILKKIGIKARPLYNIRHTFASQLISKGRTLFGWPRC